MSLNDPLTLERAGWDALSSSAEAATEFYEEVLAEEPVMLLPGGLVIRGRQAAVESMGGQPWDDYSLADEQLLHLGDGAAVVTYRASARRAELDYEALCASTYCWDGDRWQLVLHQQTPV